MYFGITKQAKKARKAFLILIQRTPNTESTNCSKSLTIFPYNAARFIEIERYTCKNNFVMTSRWHNPTWLEKPVWSILIRYDSKSEIICHWTAWYPTWPNPTRNPKWPNTRWSNTRPYPTWYDPKLDYLISDPTRPDTTRNSKWPNAKWLDTQPNLSWYDPKHEMTRH
jgi:hypothetical protein